MATSLDDVFNGVVSEPEVSEPEAAKETESPEVDDSTGEKVEVTEEVEKPEPEPDKEEPPASEPTKEVPLAAVLDERDKRKEAVKRAENAEQRAKELEEKIASAESGEKPDFWENPEHSVQSIVETEVQKVKAELTAKHLRSSIKTAATRHDDYNDAFDAFKEAAAENPSLSSMAADADDPGDEIYRIGKNFLQLEQSGGDVEAMREQIRVEERQKILDEMKAKDEKHANVPQPITDETSATAPREKVEGGPTPLNAILPNA